MTITVGFLVFPGIQQLDLAGPYEIFFALPDGEIHLFWKTRELVACSAGMRFYPTTTLGDGPLVDVLCIPGGVGINLLLLDKEVQAWVQRQASAARFVTSVCTGALLLGAAGSLAGRRATTHSMVTEPRGDGGQIPDSNAHLNGIQACCSTGAGCSERIGQPRASARARRRGSGSTATGWVTVSSKGRSLWESL